MFGKLIKYNLKAIFKSILPFIIALLASVIFFNLTDYEVAYIYDENGHVINEIYPEIIAFFHGLFSFTITCSIILLFAVTVRAIWHRFSTNFYSDEAYLTHTLPVPRATLWNAQICSMLIIFATVITTLTLSGLILALTHDGQRFLESFGLIGGCSHCVGDYYYVEPLSFSFYCAYALLIFIEFVFLTLCGMTGIILKNRFHRNISLISGFCIYLIGGLLILLTYMFLSTIYYDFFASLDTYPPILTPSTDFNYNPILITLLFVSAFYACYSIILYFVDRKLLKHGINLD